MHSVSWDEGHKNHKKSQLNSQILKLVYDCGRRLWCVTFPVVGLITRLQELIAYRVL